MAEQTHRVAIETHYVGPTDYRGSRIVAAVLQNRQRIMVSYDHSLNADENHAAAAQALADRLGWGGRWIGGGTARGYAFVNIEGER